MVTSVHPLSRSIRIPHLCDDSYADGWGDEAERSWVACAARLQGNFSTAGEQQTG